MHADLGKNNTRNLSYFEILLNHKVCKYYSGLVKILENEGCIWTIVIRLMWGTKIKVQLFLLFYKNVDI